MANHTNRDYPLSPTPTIKEATKPFMAAGFNPPKKDDTRGPAMPAVNTGSVRKKSNVSSERFQSSKEGLTMYKDGAAIALPARKREAIRVISENLNTKADGRERKKLAKSQYADIKNKPTNDSEMRKQNKEKSKCAQAGKAGPGNNFCKSKSKF